ncbi:hypothetical protein [Hyphococcus sp. DH-69]|uniref:glucuronyl esterase domain-containing protein n=1 Tax=Hyphococcus formosus TaxID=3143534 RepID=UPI00398BB1F5
MRSLFALLFLASALIAMTGCTRITLAWADLEPNGDAATPPVLGSSEVTVPTPAQWQRERVPALRAAFEREVYGEMPDDYQVNVLERRLLAEAAYGGALYEYRLQGAITFGETVNETRPFYMNVLLPTGVDQPPIILMETFCPRWNTIPHEAVTKIDGMSDCTGNGPIAGLMRFVFGRYIATPPLEMILAQGYGVATIFPSEYVPDDSEAGLVALEALSNGHDGPRWGAIAAWAWGYSAMIDVLENDPATAQSAFISWGHSRYGKSALLAAAYDARVDMVIAHQSGTGGASLNREKRGESIAAITKTYPHWFSPNYADFAGREAEMTVDQHQLLALIAPRPVMLGNARRDVWSDPNGAFRAAQGADPVYALYGRAGLAQDRLDQWKPDADLAFWIRPGTHGVVEEDWPAFLEFLDAHKAQPSGVSTAAKH